MNNPKITVLMPAYNSEKFIREAIESILAQTYKDFEFLIVCEPCTDNTVEIIKQFKDPRIKLILNKKKLGLAKSLNIGIHDSRGEYIARMDTDDIAFSNRLELQYDGIKNDPEAALVTSYYYEIDENKNRIRTVKDGVTSEEFYFLLNFRNCIGHSTVMFNKVIVRDEFNGYSEKEESEDFDLWLRIVKKYKIIKLHRMLMEIRHYPSSKSMRFSDLAYQSAFNIAQHNLQSLLQKQVDKDIVSILADVDTLKKSPIKIRQAMVILDEIYIELLKTNLPFLNNQYFIKYYKGKKNILKLYLLAVILFNSNFGSFFKAIYKLYRIIRFSNPGIAISKRLL